MPAAYRWARILVFVVLLATLVPLSTAVGSSSANAGARLVGANLASPAPGMVSRALVITPSTVPSPPVASETGALVAVLSQPVSDGTVSVAISHMGAAVYRSACAPTRGVCVIPWSPGPYSSLDISMRWSGDGRYAPTTATRRVAVQPSPNTSSGIWRGSPVGPLTKVDYAIAGAGFTAVHPAGTLQGFHTADPRYRCLNGVPLAAFWAPSAFPGDIFVRAAKRARPPCPAGVWVFSPSPVVAGLRSATGAGHRTLTLSGSFPAVQPAGASVQFIGHGPARAGAIRIWGAGQVTVDVPTGLSAGDYWIVVSWRDLLSSTLVAATSAPSYFHVSGPSVPLILSPATVVLAPATLRQLIPPASRTYATEAQEHALVFARSAAQLNALKRGDILVAGPSSLTPYGLLRKVTGVARSGRWLLVTSTAARLTDAIRQGSFEVHSAFQARAPRAAAPQAILAPILSTVASTGASHVARAARLDIGGTIHDQLASMCQDLQSSHFGLDFSGQTCLGAYADITVDIKGINYVHMAFSLTGTASADVTLDAHPAYSWEGEYPLGPENIDLCTGPLQACLWVDLQAGIFPLPVRVDPVIGFVLGGKVDAAVKAKVVLKVNQSVTAAIECTNLQCSPTFDLPQPDVVGPTFTYSVDGSFEGYVGAHLALAVEGLAGPQIGLTAYDRATVQAPQSPCWALEAGLRASVGIHLDKLISPPGWEDKSFTSADKPFLSTSGPCPSIPTQGGGSTGGNSTGGGSTGGSSGSSSGGSSGGGTGGGLTGGGSTGGGSTGGTTQQPANPAVSIVTASPSGEAEAPGSSFHPSVTVQTSGFALDCSQDFLKNTGDQRYGAWPDNGCVPLGSNKYLFYFNTPMQAPSTPSTYHTQWQIWHYPDLVGPPIDLWFTVPNPVSNQGSSSGDGIQVCEGSNYTVPCTTLSVGKYNDLSTLGWYDRIGSVRFLGTYVGSAHVVLHTEINLQGNPVHLDGDSPNVAVTDQSLNHHIRSIEIYWKVPTGSSGGGQGSASGDGIQVCDGTAFGGQCITLSVGKYNDLSTTGWSDRIASVRFLGVYVGTAHVVLHTEINLQGNPVHLDGDSPDVAVTDQSLSHHIRSIEIYWKIPQDPATLPTLDWVRANYGGTGADWQQCGNPRCFVYNQGGADANALSVAARADSSWSLYTSAYPSGAPRDTALAARSLTLFWAGPLPVTPTPTPTSVSVSWQVRLSASPASAREPLGTVVTISASASQDVGATPYYIRIVDLGTGQQLAACKTGTVCAAQVSSNTPLVRYLAGQIARSDGSDLQAQAIGNIAWIDTSTSTPSPTPSPSVTSVPWQVRLSASPASAREPLGTVVTISASASQDVGATPYYIRIVDLGTGQQLAACKTGTVCTAQVSSNTPLIRYLDVQVALQDGSDLQADAMGNIFWVDDSSPTPTPTSVPQVVAGSSGPNYPTSATQAPTSPYGFNWWNPDGVEQIGGAHASAASNSYYPAQMNLLTASGYGFNIPTNATITGIVAEVNRQASQLSAGRFITDATVQLTKGGSAVGSNKADTVTQWDNTATHTITYGGPNDLWGTAWTPSDINSPGFGLAFTVQGEDRSGSTTSADVDFIRLTVYYTVSG